MYIHFASSHNQKDNKFKNKKLPELPENRTVWKSDTKGLKKKHSSRPVGGTEKGSQGGGDSWQGSGWRARAGEAAAGKAGGPTFACRLTGRNNWGVRQTTQPRAPAWGNKAAKSLTEKNCAGLRREDKLLASQESSLERPMGSWSIHKLTHPGISTRRAQFACGWRRKWLKVGESQASSTVPSRTAPVPHIAPHAARRVAPPWWIPKALPLTGTWKQKKYGPNERTDQSSRKKYH